MAQTQQDLQVPQEILDQTYQIDGYDFGDRLLENVMFEYEVDQNLKVINFRISKEHEEWFKRFNADYWYEVGTKSAQWHLDVCKEALKDGEAWDEMINWHQENIGDMSSFFAGF